MPVRSDALAVGVTAASGFTTVFTCPAGRHVILKSIYVLNAAAELSVFTLNIHRPSAGTTVTLVEVNLGRANYAPWEGWAVLEPGDLVVLNSNVASQHYWLSGASLPLQ